MFKVGDKVICIDSISSECGGPITGEFFIVTSIGVDSIGFPLLRLTHNYHNNIKTGKVPNWGNQCFKLISNRKQPTNEIEWLDQVQQNFKE